MEWKREEVVPLCISCFLIICFIMVTFSSVILGIDGYGPYKNISDITIISKHIDSGKKSHYMVTTNQGTFEVGNGYFLGVWNSDEIYGNLKENKNYDIRIKGNKIINFFFQEYPYIIEAKEVKQNEEK